MKSFQEFVKDLENTSTEASPLGEKGNEIEPQNLNDEPAKSIDMDLFSCVLLIE